uniref:hypothetical protein n=1 Tax=Prevotella sp. TaxID=59823 RepID=UPI004024EDBA
LPSVIFPKLMFSDRLGGYGADKGIEPPTLRGYLRESGHDTSKILRVLNAFYDKLTERDGKESMPIEEFKRRKQVINEQSKLSTSFIGLERQDNKV